MKTGFYKTVGLVAVILLTTGCYHSIEQQLYQGEYDEVLSSSLDRISRSNKRDAYIDMALRAYEKVNEEERDQIHRLKASNPDGRQWGRIYDIYRRMDRRQSSILPYLPFTYEDGHIVEVPVYDLFPVLEEARMNAARYHYTRAVDLLENSDRRAGRQAYTELLELQRYDRSYRDSDELIRQAVDLGTNRVLFRIAPGPSVSLPRAYLSDLGYADYESRMPDWTRMFRSAGDSTGIDLVAEIRIDRILMGPQRVREVHYAEEKTVEDGTRPLYDKEGQPVVDSLGQPILVTQYRTLRCNVTEWWQERDATVQAFFEIRDLRTGELLARQPLEDRAVFEHVYATANGDYSILSNEVRRRLNQRPVPFPSDADMLALTVEPLRRQIESALHRHSGILAQL